METAGELEVDDGLDGGGLDGGQAGGFGGETGVVAEAGADGEEV